jgi:RNA polymerase sigma factor (sigma-70 family)
MEMAMGSETGAPRTPPTQASESFESFFSDRYEPLLRALFLLTGDVHEAEELAQEAFARIFDRWGRLQDSANPAGYAYRTALNLHRSRLRRVALAARRHRRTVEDDPLRSVDDRDAIRRALSTIPEGQRQALVLIAWLDLSDREAAEVLRTTPEAVRMRASRARKALREELGRGEDDG